MQVVMETQYFTNGGAFIIIIGEMCSVHNENLKFEKVVDLFKIKQKKNITEELFLETLDATSH